MGTIGISLGLSACLGALLALMSPVGDGSLLAAPTAVAVGVVAAAALHGRLDWLAVSFGAPSALAWTLLGARGRFDLGAAACLALWAAPSVISRGSTRAAALPAGLAAAGALVGAKVLTAYARDDVEHRLAACVFAGAALAMSAALAPRAPSAEAEPAPAPQGAPPDQDAARSSSDSTSRGSSP